MVLPSVPLPRGPPLTHPPSHQPPDARARRPQVYAGADRQAEDGPPPAAGRRPGGGGGGLAAPQAAGVHHVDVPRPAVLHAEARRGGARRREGRPQGAALRVLAPAGPGAVTAGARAPPAGERRGDTAGARREPLRFHSGPLRRHLEMTTGCRRGRSTGPSLPAPAARRQHMWRPPRAG